MQLEPLEPRILLSSDVLSLDMATAGNDLTLSVTAQLDPATQQTVQQLQVTDNGTGSVVDTRALTGINEVVVTGTGGDDSLAVDSSVLSTVLVRFSGDLGLDTLVGPDVDTSWALAGLNQGTSGGIDFGDVENIRAGSGLDAFLFADGASLTGTLDGGAGTNTLDYSSYTTGVTIDLRSQGATGTGGFDQVQRLLGGSAQNFLIGPAADTTWDITGTDAGTVAGIEFGGFENLTGAAGNQDTFIVQAGGSLTGLIDGGAAGFDTLVLRGGTYDTVSYTLTGPDSGSVDLDGTVISYVGLEPVVDESDAANVVVTATGDDDDVLLQEASATQLRVSSTNGGFEEHLFNKPSLSLTIDLGTAVTDTPNLGDRGSDTITFNLMDSGFVAALTVQGDDGIIVGGGSVLDFGGQLTVMAGATIDVQDGASLVAAGDIQFLATALRDLVFAELSVKDLFVNEADVGSGITIGDATLDGANIVLGASASASKFSVFDIFEAGLPALIQGNLAEMSNPGGTVLTFSDNGGINLTGSPILTFIDGGLNSLTGSPQLVFAANGAGPDTITRSQGSWLADGFAVGQLVTVEGSTDNDTTYRVADISPDGLVLTIEEEGLLVDEIATGVMVTSPLAPDTIRRSSGSWAGDGFAVGQVITVDGTRFNDGRYVIAALSANGLDLTLGETDEVTDETTDSDLTVAVTASKPDTITRSVGNWLVDGFAVGQEIKVIGSDSNDGAYTIAGITDRTLTLAVEDLLQNEVNDPANDGTVEVKETFTSVAPDDVPLVALDRDGNAVGQAITAGALRTLFERAITESLIGFVGSPFEVVDLRSTADVTIRDGAVLTAATDVTIFSSTVTEVVLDTPSFVLGAAYAESMGTARAVVEDGATITAQLGTFNLDATVTNTLNAAVQVSSDLLFGLVKLPGPKLAFSYGRGVSTSEARVDPGAAIQAVDVSVGAQNNNDFDVSAKAKVRPGIGIGAAIGVAISDMDSTSTASLAGTVMAANDVAVRSDSINLENDIEANTAPKKTLVGRAVDQLKKKTQKSSLDQRSNPTKLDISGAMAFAESSNLADAHVGAGARVTAGLGDVDVGSRAEDNFKAIAIGGATSGATVSIGGAVAVADYLNEARASVEDNAIIDVAQALTMSAEAVIPNQILVDNDLQRILSFDFSPGPFNEGSGPVAFFDSVDTFMTELGNSLDVFSSIQPYLSGNLGVPDRIATTYVGASSQAGSNGFALSGSVNLTTVGNTARAWIGESVQILNADTVTVSAVASIETINISGIPSAKHIILPATKSEGSSVGGTYTGIAYDNSAEAYIDDGADVSASGDVEVTADATNFIVDVVESGGKARKIGISGAFAINDFTNRSWAYIEDQARVQAGGNVLVDAHSDLVGVIIAGTVQSGGNVGVGVTLSINEVDNDTQASIGNVETSALLVTGLVSAGGDVRVLADSRERLYAISIAAKLPGGAGKTSGAGDTSQTKGKAAAGNAKQSGGVGISGDVSLNFVSDVTHAYVSDGATVNAANDLFITAGNDAFVLAISGAFALQISASSGGLAIAGSYTENDLDRDVKAFARDAAITARDVEVRATTTDKVLSITAGGGGSPKAGSVAVIGSVNLNLIMSDTQAGLWGDTTVVATGDVTIDASYTLILTSVAGVISVGGSAAIGAAVDVSIIDSTVKAFIGPELGIPGTLAQVDADGNLVVTASNEETIVSVGASVAGGTKGLGIVGSASSQNLDTLVEAFIGQGATVGVDKNLLVDAQDTAHLVVVGGGVGLGKTAGVGLALANTNINRDVRAFIADGATVDAYALTDPLAMGNDLLFLGSEQVDGIRINAAADDRLRAVAATGAGGKTASIVANAVVTTGNSLVDASIGNADVNQGAALLPEADQSVQVTASHDTDNLSVAGGVSGSGSIGFGASNDTEVIGKTVLAHIDGSATVAALNDVEVRADSTESILSVAATLGGAGKLAIGGAVSVLVLNTMTKALIGADAVVVAGNDILVTADQLLALTVVDVSAVGAGTVGVGGSVAVVTQINEVGATIGERAVVSADGSVSLSASSDLVASSGNTAIDAVAGHGIGVGSGAGGGTAGVGIANVTFVRVDTVEASVARDAQVTARGRGSGVDVFTGEKDASGNRLTNTITGLSVAATSFADLIVVAVAGSGAGTAGVAGSATVTVLTEVTKASIGQDAQIDATNADPLTNPSVSVLASDATELLGIAGSLTFGGTAGVGAGADVGVITKSTEASIAKGADVLADENVILQAKSEEDVISVSAAGSGGGTAGIAGTAGVYVVTTSTSASIEDAPTAPEAATVSAGGSVVLSAESDTELDVISGNVAGSGTASVGAAASVPVVTKSTEAFIGTNAEVSGKGNASPVDVKTGAFTVGFQADSNAGGEVAAESPDFGNYGRTFDPTADVDNVAETIDVGSDHGFDTGDEVEYSSGGGAAIGGLVDGNTYFVIGTADPARVQLALTEQDARAGNAIDLDATVATGAGHSLAPAADDSFSQQRAVTPQTAQIAGVAVSAVSQDDIESAGVSGGGSGTVAVNIGGDVHVMTSSTRAYIADGALVNANNAGAGADQTVLVAAGHDYYHLGIGGSVSGAGVVAVAPSAAVTVVTATTEAFIADGALVNAEKDVIVAANSEQDILTVVVGVAGSGAVAVGGSVSVVVLTTATRAFIGEVATSDAGGAHVTAGGNVLVSAHNATDVDVIAGSIGVGFLGGGAGASVAVTVITKSTEASIGDHATVDALSAKPTDLAGIHDGGITGSGFSTESSFKGLAVQASSSEDLFTLAVAGGGGLYGGLAGGVTVEVINSATTASIGAHANVNTNNGAPWNPALMPGAGQSVNVSAANDAKVFSIGGGLGVGLAAAGGGVDVGVIRNNTSAQIGNDAEVHATQDVDVNALSKKDVDSIALSAGGGAVALVGSVSVWTIATQVSSTYSFEDEDGSIKSEDSLNTSQGSLTDDAERQARGDDPDSGYTGIVDGYAVPTFDPSTAVDSGSDTIDLGPDHGLNSGDPVEYSAGGGTPVGGLTEGETYYVILTGDPDEIQLAATQEDAANGTAIDLDASGATGTTHELSPVVGGTTRDAGGTISSSAPTTEVSDAVSSTAVPPGTSAVIGQGATVMAGDDVNVRAKEKIDFEALAGGASVGAATLGGSVVVATVLSNTEARIDDGATVAAGPDAGDDILVHAGLDEVVTGRAFAGTLATVSLGAQVVVINDLSSQTARVDGASLVQAGGTIHILAEADRDISAIAVGVRISGVTVGAAVGIANVGGTTQALLLGADVGQTPATVENVTVEAEADITAKAETVAVAAGLAPLLGLSLSGSVAVAAVDPTIQAVIGGGSALDVANDVTVTARSLSDAVANALGVTISLGAAAGASVATATLGPTITAAIGAMTTVIAGGNVALGAIHNYDANGTRQQGRGARATGTSVSAGLFAGARGAVALADASPTLEASVGSGATVDANGDVTVTARSSNEVDGSAGGLGLGAVGIGVSIADGKVGGSVRAHVGDAVVSGNDLTVVADAFSEADAFVKAVNGGLAGSGSFNRADANISPTIVASIGDAATMLPTTVDVSGDVLVQSISEADALADAVGVTVVLAGLSIGASIADSTVSPDLETYVEDAVVTAGGSITADSTHNTKPDGTAAVQSDGVTEKGARATANASGGGVLSGSGAVGTAAANAQLDTHVGGTLTATTGDVVVASHSHNVAEATGKGLTLTITGVGAIFGKALAGARLDSSGNVVSGTTTAFVGDDAVVTAGNDVVVEAHAGNRADAETITSSGGLVAGEGGDADAIVSPTVTAFIGDRAQVTAGQDVMVLADADNEATAVSGGGSFGAAAVGASLADAIVSGMVHAYVGADAVVTAGTPATPGDVHVTADARLAADADASAVAGGLAGAGAGADASARVTTKMDASIGNGATVGATQDINVSVDSLGEAVADAKGVAAGAGLIIGVSLAEATFTPDLHASIGSALVTAGRHIWVSAGSQRLSAQPNARAKATTPSGGLGLTGSGADATATASPDVEAVVAHGATLHAGQDITIRAGADNVAEADAEGIAGGLVGVGVAVADAITDGTTRARLDGSVHDGAAGPGAINLTIEALADNFANAFAQAVSVGVLSGTGADADATVTPMIQASIGDGVNAANINVSGNVTVRSQSEADADAEARGVTGGVLGIGASLADAILSPDIDTFIGSNASVTTTGGSITLESLHNYTQGGTKLVDNDARARTNASGGGVFVGNGSDADATASASVHTTASSGSTLKAGGDITIRTRSYNDAFADADARIGGVIGVGTSLADATANGVAGAHMDGSVTGGSSLTILTQTSNLADADSEASGGGLVAGNGAVSTATTSPTVSASIGDNASVNGVTGDISITSLADGDADAFATGNTGGLAAVGVVLTTATLTPDIDTFIGSNANVGTTGGNITLQSAFNYDLLGNVLSGKNAKADSDAATGGVLAGSGTVATATANALVDTVVGANATLNAGADITAISRSHNDANANADGDSGGLVSVGEVRATATAGGTTNVDLGNINSLTAGGSLVLLSQGTSTVDAFADAAGGGVVNVAGSSANADAAPVVRALISGGSAANPIMVTGTTGITTVAFGDSTATADGAGGGVADVGTSRAIAKWRPTVESSIGGGSTTLVSGGAIDLQAFNNFDAAGVKLTSHMVKADATSTGGGVASVRGAEATAETNSTVKARIGGGASVSSGDTLNVTARSRNETDVDSRGKAGGVVGAGSSSAAATMRNQALALTDDAVVSDRTQLIAGNINFFSDSDNVADVFSLGGAGGVVGAGGADATAELIANLTKSAIGDQNTLTATGKVEVLAENRADLKADTEMTTTGAVTDNNALAATRIINSQTLAEIGNNVIITADEVVVKSRDVAVSATALSDGDVPFSLAGNNVARSVVNANVTATVHVKSGTSITAPTVSFIARSESVKTRTEAFTRTLGTTGNLRSDSDNTRTARANVVTDPSSDITTTDLLVESFSNPDPNDYIRIADADPQTVQRVVTEVVTTVVRVVGRIACGWGLFCDETVTDRIVETFEEFIGADVDENRLGSDNVSNSINFNSDVTIGGGADPFLEVDSAGKVVRADNLTVRDGSGTAVAVGDTIGTNDIIVDDILNNDPAGSVTVRALGGSTAGFSNLAYNTSFNSVTIINRSNKHLFLNDIEVSNTANPASINRTALAGQDNWNFNLISNATGSGVTITNDSAADTDITLQGHIDNSLGTTTIENIGGGGGDILNPLPTDQDSWINTRLVDLHADSGTIGTSGQRIFLRLPISATMPTGINRADGHTGVNLDITTGGEGSIPLEPTIGNISSAVGDVDLRINDAQRLSGTVFSPDNSTLTIRDGGGTDISAGGNVTITAGDPGTTVTTDLVVEGQVSAGADVLITTVAGSITSGDATHLIAGMNIDLNAGNGGIGTSSAAIRTDLIASQIDAVASGDIFITEIVGDLGVGSITSTAGNVTLTALNGAIIDAAGDGSSDVNGALVTLTASGGGIGTGPNPLEIDSGTSSLVATAISDIFITEVAGDLSVDLVQSFSGDVTLVADTGSIVDANDDAASNVDAVDIVLSALMGAIGSVGNPLDVDTNVAAFGVLRAQARDDVSLVETSGDLRLDHVSSATGNAHLTVPGGAILDDDATGSTDISAPGAVLIAGAGIGEATNPLETMVSNIEGNGGLGGIWLDNTGPLTVGGITGLVGLLADGPIVVTTSSPLVVMETVVSTSIVNPMGDVVLISHDSVGPGDDLIVTNNASVVSADGDVTLVAGDTLRIDPGSVISAAGNVTIQLVQVAGDTHNGVIEILGVVVGGTVTALGDAGDNTVVVTNVAAGSPMTVLTFGGSDTVHVGSNATPTSNTGGTLNAISDLLTIDAGNATGTDLVTVDDSGDGAANTGVLTGTSITGLGMAAGIMYAGVEDLRISLGTAGDTFTIQSTHAGLTSVNAGPGGDTINVQTISGQTTVHTGTGSDTVNVGSQAPMTGGTVDDIQALLVVDGGNATDTDTLNVDDTGDLLGNVGTLTGTSLTGLGMSHGIDYTGIEMLNIGLGSAADVFNVRGTSAVTNLSLNDGDDKIYVSSDANLDHAGAVGFDFLTGDLDGLLGALNVDAGAGRHELMISDEAAVVGDANVLITDDLSAVTDPDLSSSAEIWITGLAPAGIGYGADATNGNFYDGIRLWSGSGDDTVVIDGTHERSGARTTTVLNTGAGMDDVTVDLTDGSDGFFVLNTQADDDVVDASTSTLPLVIFGGWGDDDLTGGSADDLVFGDDGLVQYFSEDPATVGELIAQFGTGGPGEMISSEIVAAKRAVSVSGGAGGYVAGDDTLRGGWGQDVLIGGGGDDAVDGEGDRDLLFGDEVELDRQGAAFGDFRSDRFQALTGTTIYALDGTALVSHAPQLDPDGSAAWADWGIALLDGGPTTAASYDDVIAGGPDRDMIFGQLGDDVIQGDGSIAETVSASRDMNGNLLVDPSVEAATDGDDYVEGNSGNDAIFGNLGQDDLVGGSSSLFGLGTAADRPDGSDLIFGGAGTDIARNDPGDTSSTGHADDADAIAGDNANIYRLVGVNGTSGGAFLTFHYDDPAFGYDATLKIIPRAVELVDYTAGGPDFDPAGAMNDNGAADEIHGESGDDAVYGQVGNDVLFGEGQHDDLIGGYGHDWASGGTGQDGVLGDDGRIYTSRNGTAEPLYGIGDLAGQLDQDIGTPGNIQQATINVSGELKKTADLTPFNPVQNGHELSDPVFADDIIYGGLDGDFLHGGGGDDAISGAEALALYYDRPFNPGDVLRYSTVTGEFAEYDEFEPRLEVVYGAQDGQGVVFDLPGGGQYVLAAGSPFILNFDHTEGPVVGSAAWGDVNSDGDDRIFGDLGNDWLVGGTGLDNMYGGWGDDLLNADDDHSTNGGLNDAPDTHPSYEDRAFGGAGRDRLVANTGGDRLIDWAGQFNTYLVPFPPFGLATVSRMLAFSLAEFLYALSGSDGADPTRGGDPARNGEPDGELGLVRQQDFAWRDQTGAPDDPLPGNIPGGARDVLRSAAFDDPAVTGFFTDSGTWNVTGGALQVSAESLGGDAVSVFHVGEQLPGYFEIQASVQIEKPTAGWKGNAYVIFDYQGADDFKFAGIDESINKLVMGHRDATGWHVDVQGVVKGGVKPGQYYNMLVAINGVNVTLVVDNKEVFSHSYQPRVIDGYAYGLNYGYVGVGSDNSRGTFDNVRVQILPPQVTFQDTEDFDDGVADLFTGGSSGAWSVQNGRYGVDPGAGAGLSLLDLGPDNLNFNSFLEMSATVSTQDRAGFVFDRYGDESFKYAAIDAGGDRLVIGHYTSKHGWVEDASMSTPIDAGVDYTLGLTLKGATVSATLNPHASNGGHQAIASYAFNAATVDGRFGLLAIGGTAAFDDVGVKTDDSAFAGSGGAQNLTAALPAADGASAGSTVTTAQLAPIVEEAFARWTESFPEVSGTFVGHSFEIVDLPDLTLGQAVGRTVLIDKDGAGHGWFVDPTPQDDREFRPSQGTTDLAAPPNGDAAGRMDLLTVVMHELGHLLGLGDLDSDSHADHLMADTLPAGIRHQISGSFVETAPAKSSGAEQGSGVPIFTVGSRGAETYVPTGGGLVDWDRTPAVSSDRARDVLKGSAKERSSWLTRFLNGGLGSKEGEASDLVVRVGGTHRD